MADRVPIIRAEAHMVSAALRALARAIREPRRLRRSYTRTESKKCGPSSGPHWARFSGSAA